MFFPKDLYNIINSYICGCQNPKYISKLISKIKSGVYLKYNWISDRELAYVFCYFENNKIYLTQIEYRDGVGGRCGSAWKQEVNLAQLAYCLYHNFYLDRLFFVKISPCGYQKRKEVDINTNPHSIEIEDNSVTRWEHGNALCCGWDIFMKLMNGKLKRERSIKFVSREKAFRLEKIYDKMFG